MQDFNHKLRESESERRRVQDEYDTFICEQQEASFRRMESARWLPKQESEVMADLKRLKTSMRTWAKGTALKAFSLLKLSDAEAKAVSGASSEVVRFEKGHFPQALLSATRGPMLLLNALLAHEVYKSFFQSPFFFSDAKDSELSHIYGRAMDGNQEDTHMWRSQTLRLLMPLENNDSDAEKRIRDTTKSRLAEIADQKASDFLAGPAKFLVDPNSSPNLQIKLFKIFNDTANMAYELWTRRSCMKCFTLDDMDDPKFDVESGHLDPDPLVRYDDHEDGLLGQPITMIVHPILMAYGTDDAKDYDK